LKRALGVLVVSGLMLLALLSVRGFDARSQPDDEILAYQVDSSRGVRVSVPGGVTRVVVSSWLLVPLFATDGPFPYGLMIELADLRGRVLLTREFETRTRLSDVPEGGKLPSTRLADGTAWVAEPRTFELDVRILEQKAGILRVRALESRQGHSTLLLRMTHEVERGELERRIVERALGAHEVQRIMARRSSLGFFDIPEARRRDALASWERRLIAQGREGRDYFSRRLLLGDEQGSFGREPERVGGQFVSNARRLALTLTGSLPLRVHAKPESVILLADGDTSAPTKHVVPPGGALDLELDDAGTRTVELFSEIPQQVLLSAPSEARSTFVTSREPQVISGRYEIAPDSRKRPYTSLDTTSPVRFTAAPGQRTLGVKVRGLLGEGQSEHRTTVVAVWKGADDQVVSKADLALMLAASEFEHIGDVAVTDAGIARLRVPNGAAAVELTGSASTLVSAFVAEPGVAQPIRLPPYDQPPPEGMAWRYAPWQVSPEGIVHPDNVEALSDAGRRLAVTVQARLEPLQGTGPAIVPRVLDPIGALVHRSFFTPFSYIARAPFPSNGWVPLRPGQPSRPLVVGAEGRVSWMYLSEDSALGEEWTLSVDEQVQVNEPVVVRTGAGGLDVAPGAHRFEFAGLGANSLLLLKATPERSMPILKRQGVYRIDVRRPLRFQFSRRAGELLNLVVFAVSRSARASFELRHTLDGGQPRTHAGFFRRFTEPGGAEVMSAGDYGRGLVWDVGSAGTPSLNSDRVSRMIVHLGDDLREGDHQVEIEYHPRAGSEDPLWVRAVLVGTQLEQAPPL
jgi:hypothetical protein